jgi:hypothetical protein
MKTRTKQIHQIVSLFGLLPLFFFAAIPIASSQPAAPQGQQEPVLVGRISHVEGQLLRYVPAEKDWVATVKDAPFGLDDALYSDEKTKAEFVMPNNTWARTNGSTQIQMIRLENDLTEMDVASGMARFYNKSSKDLIKATTPFGYVVAGPLTTFDLYVGDKSVEVIALKGTVDFVHPSGEAKYEVIAGSPSILADSQQIGSGSGKPDAEWDDWNDGRDSLWAKRLQVTGDSKRYLPPSLYDEAYALEENGRWERVCYDGEYRYFWRPIYVSPGWAPFTVGRWTDWYGDNCWIPGEPFGYVTHHYGNWVFANNFWFWAPPVVGISIGMPLPPLPLPLLPVPFGWFPGRVSWICSGLFVGWVPLAPFEPYYCHHHWGPHCSVWDDHHPAHLDIGHYRHLDHAVIVHQNHFCGVNNYNNVRIANINRTAIINDYRIEPVVSDRVINNYTIDKQKYRFTNVSVTEKPHQTVLQRIERNQRIATRETGEDAATIQGNLTKIRQGRPLRQAHVEEPKVSNRLVPEREVSKAEPEMKFREEAIKRGGEAKPGIVKPSQPAQPKRPVQPERGIKPPRPGEAAAAVQPERRIPSPRPGQPTQTGRSEQPVPSMQKIPSPRPEQRGTMQPVRPERPEQAAKPGHGMESPGKPNQPRQGEPQKTSQYRRKVPVQRPVAREQQPQRKPQGQPGRREQMERSTPSQRSSDFGQHSQVRPQERQLRTDSHSQSPSVHREQSYRVQSQGRSEWGGRSHH